MTAAHFQHQRSNQVVRKELQQHLQQHRQLMHGYTDYLQRHAAAVLALCLNPRRDAAGQPSSPELVSAAEVDRLSLLLAPPGGDEAARRHDGDGSPMEISPSPFSSGAARFVAESWQYLRSFATGVEASANAARHAKRGAKMTTKLRDLPELCDAESTCVLTPCLSTSCGLARCPAEHVACS